MSFGSATAGDGEIGFERRSSCGCVGGDEGGGERYASGDTDTSGVGGDGHGSTSGVGGDGHGSSEGVESTTGASTTEMPRAELAAADVLSAASAAA